WRPSEGAPLYRPDTLVTVQARMVGADEPLLVSKVRYLLSGDQGRQTVLTLTGRNAFQPEPVDEPAVKSKGAAPLIKR
ncbi:MAG: phage baseplate assembly protein, partial [Caulobacteraceae bacterium]